MINFKIWILPVVLTLSACGGGGGSDPGDRTGGTITLPTKISWVAPGQNTDNSTLTDLSKFRFHYGSSVSSLVVIPELDLDAAGGSVTTLDISALSTADKDLLTNLLQDNDTHFFAMTAVNSQNIESAYSNIVRFQ